MLLPIASLAHRVGAQVGPQTITSIEGIEPFNTVSGTIVVSAAIDQADANTSVEFDLTARCPVLLTEGVAPYYLGGDTGPQGNPANEPNGFDTTQCDDGPHALVVRLYQFGALLDLEVVHFGVSNTSPTPTPTATVTPTLTPTPTPTWTPTATPTATPTPGSRPSITGLAGHGGGTISGTVNIEALILVPGGANVAQVAFDWSHACAVDRSELTAPYFWHGDTGGEPIGWDSNACADATYTLGVAVSDDQGVADTENFQIVIANGSNPTPTPVPTATPGGTLQPTLLKTYDTGGYAAEFASLQYRPRQFIPGITYHDPNWGADTIQDAGAFHGWDVLFTCSEHQCRTDPRRAETDWLFLEINRNARLGVVWRAGGSLPSWMQSGWSSAGDVVTTGGTYTVYTQDFSAGAVGLGHVEGTQEAPRDAFWVIMAESGGVPSQAPPQLGFPLANPNETCPAWAHNRFTTTIPSGAGAGTYHTWHPQIDPVYWCYFRHEHGSYYEEFGDNTWKPAFHVASTIGGPQYAEPHEQFKTVGFTEAAVGGTVLDWYFVIHFGTSNAQRGACNRRHEVRIAVANDTTGELLADLTWHADFGATIRNTGEPTPLNLSGLGCPNQQDIQNQSSSNKLVPVSNDLNANDPELVMYYPWRQAERSGVLGVQGVFLMNTTDAIAVCYTLTCEQNVLTGNTGTERFMQYSSNFGIRNQHDDGHFCTDVHGEFLMACHLQGAVPQYIKPGTDITMPNMSINGGITNGAGRGNLFTAWYDVLLDPAQPEQSNSTQLENSIQSPN